MDRSAKTTKEKTVTAAVAVSMLLVGIVIGFLAFPRTSPATVTTTQYFVSTVTHVREVPVRNMPVPFSASAQLVCIYVNATEPIEGCPEPNMKAVALTIMLTELGIENSYIPTTGLLAISPGLARGAALEGAPIDASGRIVIRPGRFDTQIRAVIPVEDLQSFINWMRDVGKIAVAIQVVDENNQPIKTITVEDIPVYPGSWSIEAG